MGNRSGAQHRDYYEGANWGDSKSASASSPSARSASALTCSETRAHFSPLLTSNSSLGLWQARNAHNSNPDASNAGIRAKYSRNQANQRSSGTFVESPQLHINSHVKRARHSSGGHCDQSGYRTFTNADGMETAKTDEPNGRSASPGSGGVQLKKELGLFNGVTLIVGIIVGSGIFVSPIGVLQESGSIGMALIVWIACGVLSTIGAICYSELGTSIPKSGGDYAYIREAFGELPAFLFLWVALVAIMPTGNAIAALTFANYILQPIYPTCTPPANAVRLLAALVVCLLTFVNCYNVKWATTVQNTFTSAKIVALVIIIASGLVHLLMGNTQNFSSLETVFEGTTTSPGQLALSFYSGLFSYAGWNYLNFVTEELKDPYRNLPRAIYISVPLVTVIYVLANISYFVVLTKTEVLMSNAVAVTFGEKILGYMSWTMPLSVALSTFGGLNGGIFASSRLFYVGAREGHLPSVLSMINMKYYTPMPTLIFLGVLTLSYLSTTQVYVLINYTAFIESLFVTFSVGALLWLRYKQPNMERPIKVTLFLPLLFFVVCAFLVLLPVYVSPFETGVGAAITLAGIPVYAVTVMWKNKPRAYQRVIGATTAFLQRLLLSVPESKDL